MPALATTPLQINRKAPRERTWLDETSWVDVVRGFVPSPQGLLQELVADLAWKQNRAIRGGRKVDDPRLDSSLSLDATRRYPALHQTRLALEARYSIRLGGVHLILYRNGKDGMGFHRDDEMPYLECTVISGLSLGAPRQIAFRPLQGRAEHRAFALESGDLYVMGGRCQADWMHGVPKSETGEPKISAVWRWSSKRGRPNAPNGWGP